MSAVWSDFGKKLSNGLIECFAGSGIGGAEQLLELGPSLFDGVEVRRIGRQIDELRASGLDSLADAFDLV